MRSRLGISSMSAIFLFTTENLEHYIPSALAMKLRDIPNNPHYFLSSFKNQLAILVLDSFRSMSQSKV